MPESANVELRGQAPKPLVDVLDAVSAHRRISRWELVVEILEHWADDKMAETTAILRVTGCGGREVER